MQFSQRTGKPVEKSGEQLIELPLALCDNEGNPLKGQKAIQHIIYSPGTEILIHKFFSLTHHGSQNVGY